MTYKQEANARGARWLPAAAALAAVLVLSGCAAVKDATRSPDEAAAAQPQRVAAEGSQEEFPKLSEVPKAPQPYLAPEEREKVLAQMMEDHRQATFSEPAPLTTAAPPAAGGTSVIISGNEIVSREQVAGLPLQTSAGGQLAAIIFFGHGSSELDGRDRSILQDLAALQRQRGGHLRVVGHASSRTQNTTPDEHQIANFDMSLARAESVAEELLALGVPPDAVSAEALGDAEPVYHEFMPSGEAGNRRVEIFLEN
ncbi:OmpA family protein [Pelagibius sp. CAU 1746]|uniref:OmpA family protein n=1 Tax=Pelagibius sp. CAU 1746 TaxID=3140370 RepID=UPI00325AADC2